MDVVLGISSRRTRIAACIAAVIFWSRVGQSEHVTHLLHRQMDAALISNIEEVNRMLPVNA